MALQIANRMEGAAVVVSLMGRLELGEKTHAVRDAVRSQVADGRKHIVLNLEGVTHMDSAGLGGLVAAYHSAHSRGATLRLCHLKPIFKELLQITGLLSVFEVFDSETQALQAQWPAPPHASHRT